jgi:hypothetical protein
MVVAWCAGCSALHSGADLMVDPAADATRGQQAMVVVELRDGDDHREYLKAPLTDSMLVQDALKGSGATSRFRRMNIVLVRTTAKGGKLRLPVKYDAGKRQVVETNNYAMHADDWLEVTEDTSTMFDRMIDSALQPLRPMLGTYRG